MASRRFDPTQRSAVVSAILTHGLTAEAAAMAAGAGELPGGEQLDPFQVSASSARHWAGIERRRLRTEQPTSEELLDACDGQVGRISRLIEKALKAEESKPPDEVNIDRLRQLGKAAVSVAQAARAVRRAPLPGRPLQGGAGEGDEAGKEAGKENWLDRLARLDREHPPSKNGYGSGGDA